MKAIDGFSGRITGPEDPGWDEARMGFNLAADPRPLAVVEAQSATDVAAVVRHAAGNGLAVAPQTTGHNATTLDLDGALLLKTTGLKGIEIDAGSRRARVGAGTTWGEVIDPAFTQHALTALHGSSGTVGVAGYSLYGGVSWYGRKRGLQSNALTAIELVTADGEERRVDAESDPDLFWALRGGGGSFGIVTALEFELFEASDIFAGVTLHPWERSAELIGEWVASGAEWPDEFAGSIRILQVPDIPDVPDVLRGGKFVVADGAFLGSAEEGEKLIEPLRALGEPVLDTWAAVPPPALAFLHMDPPNPSPGISDSRLLRRLDEAAIEELVAAAGPGSDSPLTAVELRLVGGALGRGPEGAGALAKLDGDLLYFAIGVPMDPELTEPIREHLAKLDELLAPHASGLSRYLNFCEHGVPIGDAFDPETVRRLREVRDRVNPDELIRSNHPLGRA